MLFVFAYFCVVGSGPPIVNSALTRAGDMEDKSASRDVRVAEFSSASFPKSSSIFDKIAKVGEEENQEAHANPAKSDRSDIRVGLQNIIPSASPTFRKPSATPTTRSPSRKPSAAPTTKPSSRSPTCILTATPTSKPSYSRTTNPSYAPGTIASGIINCPV